MTPPRLTAELRRRAAAEGFHSVGVAAATRLDRDADALHDWLAGGREAGMEWMRRNQGRRCDPRELLPGCRFVVSVILHYGPGGTTADEHTGNVARYARSRDYHKVMGKKLERLALWLRETSGAETRRFVDTAPVLERAWAERSGLGWIGKNANVITRERGSWLLLGEILTAAELVADDGPHADFCGSCTACIDACPTDAIVAPGKIDSRRCLSYWTIEHRGSIDAEIRPDVGPWIFGCDICQEVCPWNERFATEPPEDPLEHRQDLDGLEAAAVLRLSEEEFRTKYSGTPLMRAKWEGMRRNACVVLGNLGDPSALAALREALADPDPVIREHAAWALGRLGGTEARDALRQARTAEVDRRVIEEIDAALD